MKLKDKDILITGGAGFLGGALAEDLVQNNDVWIVDDLSVGQTEAIPDGCEFLNLRINYSNKDVIDLSNVDIIFHFAAPCTVLLFDKDPMALYMNAIESAYAIRYMAQQYGVPYFVYASSATWYGKTASKWFTPRYQEKYQYQEDMPAKPANVYGATKVAEEALDSLFPGPEYLPLRIFPCYGAREWLKGDVASIVYKMADCAIKNKPFDIWKPGTQMRDYIHVDDFVEVTKQLVQRDASGPFNIGSGVETDHQELAWYIGRRINPDWKPNLTDNPYRNSYLMSLKSSQQMTLEWIGNYKFTGIYNGIDLMLERMGVELRGISVGETARPY